jgi:hypothetical protein
LPENQREGNTFQLVLQGHHYPDFKVRKKNHKVKRKYRPILLKNMDVNIVNKLLAKQV